MSIKDKKKDNSQKRFVFTTKNVEEIIEKASQGFSITRQMNPWFKNQVGVRKTGCPFGWTQEEINEFTKCKLDIHYFANHFCKIKTEDGTVKQMKLRKYQYKVLDVYDRNRFVINMSSRQTGKCFSLFTKIKIKENNEIKEVPVFKLLFKYKENKSIYDYIKYPLYWCLFKIN